MWDENGDREEQAIAINTKEKQDAVAWEQAEKLTREWVRQGDWGKEGARVQVTFWIEDEEYSWENDSRSIDVNVDPDHAYLIEQAGGNPDCDHDWTGEGCGGLEENPGVWAGNGTGMTFERRCTRCGIRKREFSTGSQYNPGDHDTVEYFLPE